MGVVLACRCGARPPVMTVSPGAAMECSTLEKKSKLSTELAHLESIVRCRLAGRLRHFRLDLSEGGLVLRGRAITYYAKQLAQHAVMAETELPITANEIEVA